MTPKEYAIRERARGLYALPRVKKAQTEKLHAQGELQPRLDARARVKQCAPTRAEDVLAKQEAEVAAVPDLATAEAQAREKLDEIWNEEREALWAARLEKAILRGKVVI